MRVIAGSHRGRRLSGPQGTVLRPTSDKVREALFSILGSKVSGSHFLDLYAGTGAVGIEALSRGASTVTFVESDPKVLQLLQENLRTCQLLDRAQVRIGQAATFLDRKDWWGGPYDILFADPPYVALDELDILIHAWRPGTVVGACRHDYRTRLAYRIACIDRPCRACAAIRVWRYGTLSIRCVYHRVDHIMKIGIYPGTFDPITHGHTDIITRSLRVFDKVVVAVAPNPSKHPLFALTERLEMIRIVMKEMKQVEVTHFDGLLVDYVQRYGAHAIIRGLRAISDFEHEFQMALINRKMAKQVETVFLMPSEEYSYLSSTIIKDVATHGGALTEFLHPEVARQLQERIRSLKT